MTSEILASNRRFIYHKPNFKTFNFLPVLKYDLSYYFIFWKGSLYTPDHAVLLMGGFINMAAKNYRKNSELRLILISDYRVHLIKRQQTEY